MPNFTRIPAPRVKLVDPQTGTVADEWFRFFNNLYAIAYSGAGSTIAGTYGSATAVPRITVDDFAGITAISNVPIAIDANQIVSGTIDSARISGAYTGITGVGTLTLGTWNASTIATGYGGTGLTSYTAGDTLYYATGASLSTLPIGASTYINTSSGTAPQWTNPTTITVGKASNLVGGAVNQIPYQTATDTTGYITAPTVANTFLEWSGTTFQWSSNPLGTVTSVAATVPSFLSISGSPITTSGTLAISYSGTALPVANGGTNATSPSITAFNNITGYTASGATGTTSTNLVFSTSPTLTTPTLGVATATSINKMAITAPATSSTLAVADGKTLTANNTLTLAGTDSTTMTFPTTSATIARTDAAQTFTGLQTFGALTTTGNVILGDAATDTLNVGNGGLVKDASGNVGINTASPGAQLEILSATTATLRLASTNNQGAGATPYNFGEVQFWSTDQTAPQIIAYVNSLADTASTLPGSTLTFGTSAVGVGAAKVAERMRIFSTGGVSIGNTTDKGAASLNVSGLIYPQQATTAGAPAYVKGAIYFDTTLNKLRVGGATAWETVTSV